MMTIEAKRQNGIKVQVEECPSYVNGLQGRGERKEKSFPQRKRTRQKEISMPTKPTSAENASKAAVCVTNAEKKRVRGEEKPKRT